ncbi:MAG: preprotein translocase subunit YajC [Candidatus Marinimicrobia bacterium]|nr:preprotein translocase subunit YajC [Candidatus Neomarinimicrobiota bacterium]
MAGGGEQGGGFAMYFPFVLIMFVIYFFMIRPQTKRQKEKKNMHEALKKGDKIVTIGGIHGTIAGFKDKGKLILVKTSKTGDITVNQSAIAGLAGNVSENDTSVVEEQA